jgi:hypothetical protein
MTTSAWGVSDGVFGWWRGYRLDAPVLGSSLALFRLSRISLMDLVVPFLQTCQFFLSAHAVLTARVVTYILKLPPTKN